MVTGHDSISERSIAERLTLLKSAHSALSPVSVRVTPDAESSWIGPARSLAAFTMTLVPAAEPAVMIAVRPFREMDVPALGMTTFETRASARSSAAALFMSESAAESLAIGA